ncbi:hypothetical protein DERP_001693, partial [Dermatophagoides pteronyssinus]
TDKFDRLLSISSTAKFPLLNLSWFLYEESITHCWYDFEDVDYQHLNYLDVDFVVNEDDDNDDEVINMVMY